MEKFNHYELALIIPPFESKITDLIIDLDHLRRKELGGSTHPRVFFQLKNIFHALESIGSARIEGNNTTIAEYVESEIENDKSTNNIREIDNIKKAMLFIEENVMNYPINKSFVSQIHKILVEDLPIAPHGEGDITPGVYRNVNVKIAKSSHIPPDAFLVDELMENLFEFINRKDSSKYDLLKTAIAHHRFVWIHPFSNGNGRTVRLFTYAMLIKNGFNVDVGRILNPTAIFCNNRNIYYEKLSKADEGTDNGILEWCEYVLSGLKDEIEKIDRLTDYNFLKTKILLPTITYGINHKILTENEALILIKAVEMQVIQNSDLKSLFPEKNTSEISREIKSLKDKKMLVSESNNVRKYILRFDNNYLMRGIIKALENNNFISIKE
ncbi:Fic family protein [Ornithobacterium rhinotracheale]|uniref:Fic family protein n=1 Tax=Ornithobacterium rhinotracheale TaxID=28251 RepID=UPI001FF4AF26|nr:Fic family protein [Ornithobacterium rhinotracheale]MCK0199138.1 Fic family protein [Ornithobacterium rhinotracheale]